MTLGEEFRDRLSQPRALLLDGPMGTELVRRGISIDSPAWSAQALLTAPETIQQIHRDYVNAGAELVTANTFRTHARNLRKLRRTCQSREVTQLAVTLAKSTVGETAWVAGSMAPLEDCYQPELTPPLRELERDHASMAESLADAGVDLILLETHPTIRESLAAARAASQTGLPVMVSWVCDRKGRLLSGETLKAAVATILPLEPFALLVNCLPAETAQIAVDELVHATGATPTGVYANVGWRDGDERWWQGEEVHPAAYAQRAAGWLASGARLVGGCCGTTPAHIARLRQMLDEAETPSG